MVQNNQISRSSQKGAVLLEALISVLILALGILALVGLQARMIQNTTNTKMRADAAYLAQQQIGRLWENPANAGSLVTATPLDVTGLPAGKMTISQPSTGEFEIRLGWTAPGETTQTAANSPCGMVVAHCFITTAVVVGG